MTNAVLTKRVASLEIEMQSVKSILSMQRWALQALKKGKGAKYPRGLQTALKEVAEGKVEGPFN